MVAKKTVADAFASGPGAAPNTLGTYALFEYYDQALTELASVGGVKKFYATLALLDAAIVAGDVVDGDGVRVTDDPSHDPDGSPAVLINGIYVVDSSATDDRVGPAPDAYEELFAAQVEAALVRLATVESDLGNKASAASVDLLKVQTSGGPGDNIDHYTSSITGDGADGDALDPNRVIIGDSGKVYRAIGNGGGTGDIAPRERTPLLISSPVRVRFSYQRFADPAEPAGDEVRCFVRCLGANKQFLVDRLVDARTLTVADGPLEFTATIGREDGPGIDLVATAATRYIVPVVRNSGPDGQTDIFDVSASLAGEQVGVSVVTEEIEGARGSASSLSERLDADAQATAEALAGKADAEAMADALSDKADVDSVLEEQVARIAADASLRADADLALDASYVGLMVYGLAEASMTSEGEVSTFKTFEGYADTDIPVEGAAPALGEFETRSVAGPFSGRVRQHVSYLRSTSTGGLRDEYAPDWVQLTGGPYDAVFVDEVSPGHIRVCRNGAIDDVKFRTANQVGGKAYVDLFLSVSQSKGLGQMDTGPDDIIYNPDPVVPYIAGLRGAAMFEGVDGLDRGPRPLQVLPEGGNRNVALDPAQLSRVSSLREALHMANAQNYDTFASGLAMAWHGGLAARDSITLHAHIGSGSTAITHFEKGSVTGAHYANAEAVIAAAMAYADTLVVTAGNPTVTRTLRVHVVWQQATQDVLDGTSQAVYQAALLGIKNDLAVDVVAAGAEMGAFIVLQSQTLAAGGVMSEPAKAQAALAIAGEVGLVPVHCMKPGAPGTIHLYGATTMPLGAAAAYEVAALLDDPMRKAGHIAFSAKSGATAEFAFVGASGAGWTFDSETIENAPDNWYGFTAADDTGELTISSMAIENDELSVGFDRNIVGTLNWGFGVKHYAGATQLMPNPNAPRVNVRDGSAWTCPMTGQIVTGFLMQHGGAN